MCQKDEDYLSPAREGCAGRPKGGSRRSEARRREPDPPEGCRGPRSRDPVCLPSGGARPMAYTTLITLIADPSSGRTRPPVLYLYA